MWSRLIGGRAKRAGVRGYDGLRSLTAATLILTAAAVGLEICRAAQTIPEWPADVAAILLLGLAGIAVVLRDRGYAALLEHLDILGRALDTLPLAQLIANTDGRVGHANRAFRMLFPGSVRAPLELLRRALSPDPESMERFNRLRGRAAAGAPAAALLALTPKSGAAGGQFKIRMDPIAGRSGWSCWSIEDVTASHQSEAVLRGERDALTGLLDNAPVGFYSVDATGRFRFVNRTLARWLGGTPSEIMVGDARLADFLARPPAPGTPAWSPFPAAVPGSQRGEVGLKTREGRIFPAWVGQNIAGSGADITTQSVVSDLTPEREWKAALRTLERFRRCFETAPVGIALLDRSGCFEEANRAVGELFGVTPQSLKGRPLIELLNAEDRDRIAARLAAVANGTADAAPVEVRPKSASEKILVLFLSRLESTTAARPDGVVRDKPADGLTLHFIDITEQKNLEIQFAHSQKMQAIGQLAGGVAHDFNNLLTAMIGFCDLLLLRTPPSDPSFADIMQIKHNANRAANLVRQLLAFSRQQTLQSRVLDVTDVLYELRHLIERLIGENIELKVVHGRDLGPVKVDQGQLEQVIINLAVNARDAMPDSGMLTIRTSNVRHERAVRRGHEAIPAGEYVLIEVADTGIGIPEEHLGRIFDPFFSTKELGSGTGLGLSTVYGIVKQTGGFVFAESKPGEGTAFQIYLPRCAASDLAASARPDSGEAGAAKDLTGRGSILLVEDDDPVRMFGARALRNKGYKVLEAKSGEAALDLIRKGAEAIDLLITDVVMPHMDGPGLVREVREVHPDMKVIFISGYTEDAFRQRLDNESSIEFLPKPFSLKDLAAKVRDVLATEAA